jgi:hypothetical protein
VIRLHEVDSVRDVSRPAAHSLIVRLRVPVSSHVSENDPQPPQLPVATVFPSVFRVQVSVSVEVSDTQRFDAQE